MTDISHIGIAVKDINKAIETFTLILGHGPHEVTEVLDQKVKVAMFSSAENDPYGHIELLEGLSSDSPIAKYIEKRGEGLHHLAILVDNIELKLAELKDKGFRLIDELPRVGAEGKKIAFVHPASVNGILLELQEK